MLDNHADKGQEDWEIYAECLRQAMCKTSGMSDFSTTVRERLRYEDFMNMAIHDIAVEGRRYYASGHDEIDVEDKIKANDEHTTTARTASRTSEKHIYLNEHLKTNEEELKTSLINNNENSEQTGQQHIYINRELTGIDS
jgi:hypothetical protein